MERKIEQGGVHDITVAKTDTYVWLKHDLHGIVGVKLDNIPQLITILQQFIGNEGKCYECKRDVVLAQDYNGRNYLLCTSCLDKLNKEFYE